MLYTNLISIIANIISKIKFSIMLANNLLTIVFLPHTINLKKIKLEINVLKKNASSKLWNPNSQLCLPL